MITIRTRDYTDDNLSQDCVGNYCYSGSAPLVIETDYVKIPICETCAESFATEILETLKETKFCYKCKHYLYDKSMRDVPMCMLKPSNSSLRYYQAYPYEDSCGQWEAKESDVN